MNRLPPLPTNRPRAFALTNFSFLAQKKSRCAKQMRAAESFKSNFQKPSSLRLEIKGAKTPPPPPSRVITEISVLLLRRAQQVNPKTWGIGFRPLVRLPKRKVPKGEGGKPRVPRVQRMFGCSGICLAHSDPIHCPRGRQILNPNPSFS